MIATRQRFSRTNGQRIGFLTARTANAPQRPGRLHFTHIEALAQIATEQIERGRMTEKACFLHRQAIHQGGPLHRAARPGGDLPVVARVIGRTDLTHATAEIGLQESAALLGNHHTGTLLEQRLPFMEFRRRHIGQGLQCPVGAWLHALPLTHER